MGEHHGVDRHLPGHPQHHPAQVAQVPGNPKPSPAPLSLDYANRVHPALHAPGTGLYSLGSWFFGMMIGLTG